MLSRAVLCLNSFLLVLPARPPLAAPLSRKSNSRCAISAAQAGHLYALRPGYLPLSTPA